MKKLAQVSPSIHAFLFFLFVMLNSAALAQPNNMSINTDVGVTYSNQSMVLVGGLFQFRLQENATGAPAGIRKWQFNSDGYGNTWGARTTSTLVAYNTIIAPDTNTASGNWVASGHNDFGKLPATLPNYYYTFNIVRGSAYASQPISVVETSYNPIALTNLTDAPDTFASRRVTITTSSTPAAGEFIYVRYSTNGYATSTIVQATGAGTTWTAKIPWATSAVSFYAYTSNKTMATINAEVATFGQSVHDLASLYILNNSNSNYAYTPPTGNIIVTSTGGTQANNPVGYASFTLAGGVFDILNFTTTTHTGSVTALITADVTNETGLYELNNSTNWTSLQVQPAGNRIISGTTPLSPVNEIFSFSGADNVTFDGLNANGNSLTISNLSISSATGTATIRFIVDATNNTITNCTILGSSTVPVGTAGGTIYFADTLLAQTTGCDNNTISNCNIGPAGTNLPTQAISMIGTTTSLALNNSNNTITNNNIFDVFNAATDSASIYSGAGATANTFTNNRIYQTAARTFAAGATHSGIRIINTANGDGFSITGNTIGYASNTGTGTYALSGSAGKFSAMWLEMKTGGLNNIISSNTISNISLTSVSSDGVGVASPFVGMFFRSGNFTSNGNTIGSQSTTGSLVFDSNTALATDVFGMVNTATGTDIWNATSNEIGGVTGKTTATTAVFNIYGMRSAAAATCVFNAASNIIGGTIANSIQNNCLSTMSQTVGLSVNPSRLIASLNTIRNLTSIAGTGSGITSSVIGILTAGVAASNPNSIAQSIIYNLTNTNSTQNTAVVGMQMGGATANSVVERNFIYDLKNSSSNSAAEITGIKIPAGPTTFRNNKIALGAGVTVSMRISGIDNGSSSKIYHNSVYISGDAVSGTTSSAALLATTTSGAIDYRNNIFVNARNSTTAGNSAIITAVLTGVTINNNLYFKTGTGGSLGTINGTAVTDLTTLRAATSQDAGSFVSDPQFIDPANALPNLNISTATPTAVESGGITGLSVTNDFDNVVRSISKPDLGSYEGNFIILDNTPPVIGYTAIPTQNTATPPTFIATITDSQTGINTTPGTRPRMYYKKCSASNTIIDNNSTTDGWKYVEASNTTSPFNFIIDYSLVGGGANGSTISYFVVAQDTSFTTNIAIGNSAVFATMPSSVDLATANLAASTPQSYIHLLTGGVVSVGDRQTFSTVTGECGLFKIVNLSNANITSNIVANITSNLTELNTHQLNVSGGTPGSFSVSLVPDSATLRTISGTIINAAAADINVATQMIGVTGNGKLVIDGRFGGAGKHLLFRNTSATPLRTCPVLNLTTGANPTSASLEARYATFEGNNANNSFFAAGIINLNANAAGDIRLTIDNCVLRGATGGTTGSAAVGLNATYINLQNTCTNNEFDNIYVTPISISNCKVATITGNSMYQSVPFTASHTDYSGIHIITGSNLNIADNVIGGSAVNAGGTPMTFGNTINFLGIHLQSSLTNTTVAQGNKIQNIALNSTGSNNFSGIYSRDNIRLNTGTGNTIGHLTDATKGISIAAMFAGGHAYGINATAGGTPANFNNNTISNIATTERFVGISQTGTCAVQTFSGNTISNIATTGGITFDNTNGVAANTSAQANAQISGILFAPGAETNTSVIIEKNTIFNIGTSYAGTNATAIIGIAVDKNNTARAEAFIRQNKIYDLYNQSTATTNGIGAIVGIRVHEKRWDVHNNMISLTNKGFTNNINIYGIMEGGTTFPANNCNYYYNSVYIGGTAAAANTAHSAAFTIYKAIANTFVSRNNIFSNFRTGGTGAIGTKHYAVSFNLEPNALANYNAANNDLFTNNLNALCYRKPSNIEYSLATWQALNPASYDSNSIETRPYFIDVAAGDLHLVGDSNCDLDGTGLATNLFPIEFDEVTARPTSPTKPDIGADEFNNTFQLTVVDAIVTCATPTVDLASLIVATGTSGGATTGYFSDAAATVVYATPNAAPTGTYYIKLNTIGCKVTKPVVVSGVPTSTYAAGVWSINPPTATNALVIDDNLTVPANTVINGCSCIVLANRNVVFSSGSTLNLLNGLTVDPAASLTFENNSSLVQEYNNAVNNGNIIYNRNALVKKLDYVYWSAPTAGKAVTSIYAGTPVANTLQWNPAVANYNGSEGDWSGVSENMIAGKGYAIRVPNALDPVTASTVTTTFVGVPHNGIYTFGIARGTRTGADVVGPNGATITSIDDNWNLIGNPYPSAIDADIFMTANPSIEGSIDIWTHGTTPGTAQAQPFYGTFANNYSANDYITYNSVGAQSGPGPVGKIAAGQGFFVKMLETGPASNTVVFDNSMRNASFPNSNFYRPAPPGHQSRQKSRIWLDLVQNSSNTTTRILVGYLDGATAGRDRMFDATADYQGSQSFHSLIDNGIYAIQGRALPFEKTDVVPLGFVASAAGTYTIGIHAADGLFANNGQTVYLQDNVTGIVHNLSAAPYSFVTAAGGNKTRFVLRYISGTLSNNNTDLVTNQVLVFKDKTMLKATSLSEQIAGIAIFDVLGRNVFSQNNINANSFETDHVVLQQQALIVKVTLANGVVVTKKIVY